MKKPKIHILVVLAAVFAAFTLGLLLGRNSHHGPVTLSIPPAMQTEPAETTADTLPTAEPVSFPIDINTAGKEEFMALPGIGEVFAERIVDYREAFGAFSNVEALLNVEGIGEKRLEEILEYITVGG